MMRTMYSFVSSSEVSEPEAISAWSWATVASLCRVGTLFDALCPMASFTAATGSASNAARRRDRMAGAIILFLLGRLGHAIPHTRTGREHNLELGVLLVCPSLSVCGRS